MVSQTNSAGGKYNNIICSVGATHIITFFLSNAAEREMYLIVVVEAVY